MQVLSLFIQMNDTRLVYACILSLHMHLSVMHHSPRLVVGADYIGPDPSSMSIGSFISRLHFSCLLLTQSCWDSWRTLERSQSFCFLALKKDRQPLKNAANMGQFASPVTEETYSEAGKRVLLMNMTQCSSCAL